MTLFGKTPAQRPDLPPLDLAQPAVTRTATFALG
jgi:hypothetical protein